MYGSLEEYIYKNPEKPIKIHLGCGSKYWKNWCNIDGYKSKSSDTHRGQMKNSPDLWLDIRRLEVNDNSVDAICSHHVMEHFYRYEVIKMFKNYYEKLKPGGVIITEMPNLDNILKLIFWLPLKPNYSSDDDSEDKFKNRDMITSQLYGASWEENKEGYPYHKYVWKKKEFVKTLKDIGFLIVLQTGATKSHLPYRDMAVICQKPLDEADDSLSELSILFKKNYGSKFFRIKIQIRAILKLFKISFFQLLKFCK